MSINQITDLIVAIVTLIPTLISVIALIINIIKNKNWTLVQQIADSAMRQVEGYSKDHTISSNDKLDMALDIIRAGLETANIKCDTKLLKRVITYITDSIDWFNEMKYKISFEIFLF